jgi:hypothetical protein
MACQIPGIFGEGIDVTETDHDRNGDLIVRPEFYPARHFSPFDPGWLNKVGRHFVVIKSRLVRLENPSSLWAEA